MNADAMALHIGRIEGSGSGVEADEELRKAHPLTEVPVHGWTPHHR